MQCWIIVHLLKCILFIAYVYFLIRFPFLTYPLYILFIFYIKLGTSTSGTQKHTNECSPSSGARTLGYQTASTGSVYTTFTSDATSSASELGFLMYMISANDFCKYKHTTLHNFRKVFFNN